MSVDPRLVQYIQAELGKGFSQTQVRLALTQSGYAPGDIDAALRELSTDLAGAQAAAQSLARSGATQAQTQAQLVQAGYAGTTASRAVRDVYGVSTSVTGTSHVAIFAIIALVVGAGGMWLLLGSNDGGDERLLPGAGPTSFAPAEIIAQVLEIARAQGTDAGVRACTDRLTGRDRDLCVLDVAILPEIHDMTLCDRIGDVQYADACYLNFLGDDVAVDAACAKVRLAENRDTCEAIQSLRDVGSAA